MPKFSFATPLIAAVIGFVFGTLVGGRSALPDFIYRLRWSWSGGGGETADWGEPLFYVLVMGVPIGLLASSGAFVLAALVQCWIRMASGVCPATSSSERDSEPSSDESPSDH